MLGNATDATSADDNKDPAVRLLAEVLAACADDAVALLVRIREEANGGVTAYRLTDDECASVAGGVLFGVAYSHADKKGILAALSDILLGDGRQFALTDANVVFVTSGPIDNDTECADADMDAPTPKPLSP